MPLFAVTRTRGSAWREGRSLEEQPDWAGHAAFMNGLAREGLVVLGGPLDGTSEVLLIFRAQSPDEIRARLAGDPWAIQELLHVTRVLPWTLRLGVLP